MCVEHMLDVCAGRLRAGVLLDQDGHWATGEFKWPLEWHTAVTDTMTAPSRPAGRRRSDRVSLATRDGCCKLKRRSDSAIGPSPVRSRLRLSLRGLAEEREHGFESSVDPVVHATARDVDVRGREVLSSLLSEASLSKRCGHECLLMCVYAVDKLFLCRFEDDLQQWLAAGELPALSDHSNSSNEMEQSVSIPTHQPNSLSQLSLREKMDAIELEIRATRQAFYNHVPAKYSCFCACLTGLCY